MLKRIKYFLVDLLPFLAYFSFTMEGWICFLPLILVFAIVPFLELFTKADTANFDKETAKLEKENKLYSWILYLSIPVQISMLFLFFNSMQNPSIDTITYIGRVSAMGILCGILGINIGHELGHRLNRVDQFFGELLLLTSLNTHFLPYHNGGHHFNVATPQDAATARRNEPLYLFWFRSHFMSYQEAWQLENKRMKSLEKPSFSWANKMVVYSIANILVIGGIYWFFGLSVLIAFLLACIMGILLLETVNYIEHYGLLRTKNEHGRYERVKHTHSWNSDHVIGKLFLFNLSRHSDHHYNGSKPYQVLKSLPESPQMPTGYPGMMLLALLPPLWFRYMNPKVAQFNQ